MGKINKYAVFDDCLISAKLLEYQAISYFRGLTFQRS